jgi:Tol biopolymer transport system component
MPPAAPPGLVAYAADVDGNWDFEHGNADIYVLDPDAPDREPVNLTRHPANDFSPEWSPDGERIAFRTDRDGNHEIYVMDADGSNPVNLTKSAADERSPAWSPDGEHIAFASDRDGEFDIYVMDHDGAGVRRIPVPGSDEYPTWSPDGVRFAFTNACSTCGGFSLHVMDLDGDHVRTLGVGAGWPDWSPDGERIAFDGGAPGDVPEIELRSPVPGSRPRTVARGVQADWSPDARELVYSRGGQPHEMGELDADLYIAARDGSGERALTSTPGVFEFEPTFQPTGTSAFVSLDPEVTERLYRENLPRFRYDAAAPLRVVRESRPAGEEGVRRYELTYQSPRGGRVPTTLLVPAGPGPHAGMIVQHGMPGTRADMIPLAQRFAEGGAVVVAIDAPWARPGGSLERGNPVTMTRRDAFDQEQLIVDLRRAVDLLVARDDVDPGRIGYLGVSYGGAMGGLLAGVEHRIAAFDLVVGDGGLVTHVTGPGDLFGSFWSLPRTKRQRWISAMTPIEPLSYVGHAAPSSLLFQSGLQDEAVPPSDAVVYQAAGSEPKEVLWYESGHALPDEAWCDALGWFIEEIGLMPPAC